MSSDSVAMVDTLTSDIIDLTVKPFALLSLALLPAAPVAFSVNLLRCLRA
jgi:hypothetical protein